MSGLQDWDDKVSSASSVSASHESWSYDGGGVPWAEDVGVLLSWAIGPYVELAAPEIDCELQDANRIFYR